MRGLLSQNGTATASIKSSQNKGDYVNITWSPLSVYTEVSSRERKVMITMKEMVYEIAFRVLRNQPNMVADNILSDCVDWPASHSLIPLMRHICEEINEEPGEHITSMMNHLREGDVPI